MIDFIVRAVLGIIVIMLTYSVIGELRRNKNDF